jgi:hypothetical protein
MLLRKELDSVVQKTSKKVKKSLSGFGKFTKRGKVGRQTSRLSVQKYFEKSEKKACQAQENSIILRKPNQTNGETND